MLKLDLNHIIQQRNVRKGTCALGMPNIPPFEENQQSEPLLLTLPNVMTSNIMELPTSTPCETSITTIPIDIQRKSLIDMTPIPKRNISHCQINMMSQGEKSKIQRYQNNNSNMMFNSQGHNQLPRLHQPTLVQGLNTSNLQPSYAEI
jgi:hypothetical protein